MDSFFSEVGISAFDFIYLSAFYLATMLNFFALKERKHRWLKYGSLVVFVLQSLFFILFHNGLNVKLFAGLMLMSALIIQGIVARRRRLEAREHSQAR
ncbi:MAG TPA: hypothetical protein VF544_09020 [Pyrinomonadaceae bacterium]|jgi:hypothetical protein